MSKSEIKISDDIITLSMSKLGFKPDPQGNCDGLTSAFIEELAHGKVDKFSKTMDYVWKEPDLITLVDKFIKEFKITIPFNKTDFIKENPYKGEKEFTPLQEKLFNVVELFKKIRFYQLHGDYVRTELKYTVDPIKDIPLDISHIAFAQNNLTQVHLDSIIYTFSEWCNYLESLRSILYKVQSHTNSFYLGIRIHLVFEYRIVLSEQHSPRQNHVMGLYYDHQSDQWMLTDTGLLEIFSVPCPMKDISEAEQKNIFLDLDKEESKKLKGSSLRNFRIINYIETIYHSLLQGSPFVPAVIQIFTNNKNPDLDLIKKEFLKLKYLYKFTSTMTKRLTPNGSSLMHLAAMSNDVQIIKWLLEEKFDLDHKNHDRETPLHHCAQRGAVEVMKMLLTAPTPQLDINAIEITGKNPAMLAAYYNQAETLILLAEAGVNLKQQDETGHNIIHIAAQENSMRVMKVLLNPKWGIDINQTTDKKKHFGNTAVCITAIKDNWEILEWLIAAKADINLQRTDGYAPLHMAAQQGSSKVMAILLKSNININSLTSRGTAACIASSQNQVDVLKFLIKAKADLNISTSFFSPLHIAAVNGSVEAMESLLEEKDKINLNLTVKDGITAVYLAVQENKIKILNLLIKAGASIFLSRENGLSPLHVAACMGHLEIVKILLENKADPYQKTKAGETALMLAKSTQKYHIVSFFSEEKFLKKLGNKRTRNAIISSSKRCCR
jgi:ankyrin repeat protein